MTKELADIDVQAIVLCKAITKEPSGADTFHGVINSGALIYYGEPREQTIAISVILKVKREGFGGFDLELSGTPLEKNVLMGVSDQNFNKYLPNEYVGANAVGVKIKLINSGEISFNWRQKHETKWKLVRVMRVKPKEMPYHEDDRSYLSASSTIGSSSSLIFPNALKRPF